MTIPRVFISYSHDSEEHKKWVFILASQMRNNGIDAIIDQWELKAGSDIPAFVEENLRIADFIVMVCTEKYVDKANKGVGGVGYEKMIITSNYMKDINESKVIPILRQENAPILPTFLGSKFYLNFSLKSDFEYCFDELIRIIHDAPLFKKPKIGNNPFIEQVDIPEPKKNTGLEKIMEILIEHYEHENYFTDEIDYHEVFMKTKISRIYFEHLIDAAVNMDLLSRLKNGRIVITSKGRTFAVNNNIVKSEY